METLVDCGGFRYHLAVQYNDDEDSCQENVLLKKVWDALEAEDDAAVTEARDACMELVWPLMLADYAMRVELNQRNPDRTTSRYQTWEGMCYGSRDIFGISSNKTR